MDFLITVGSYALIFIATILLINALTKGFILAYIKVLTSGGSKLLVHVSGIDHYFTTGEVTGSSLVIKKCRTVKHAKGIKQQRINIKGAYVYRLMLVNCVNYDERKNAILKPKNLEAVKSVDPVIAEQTNLRALKSPGVDMEELMKKNLFITVGAVIVVGLIAIIFLRSVIVGAQEAILTAVKNIATKEVKTKGVVNMVLPVGVLIRKWLK